MTGVTVVFPAAIHEILGGGAGMNGQVAWRLISQSIFRGAALLLFLTRPQGAIGGEGQAPAPVVRANWELAARWDPGQISARLGTLTVEPIWDADGSGFSYEVGTGDSTRTWRVDSRRRHQHLIVAPAAESPTVAPPAADTPDYWKRSPDGSWAVYVRGNDLYLVAIATPERETRLTTDGRSDYTIGTDPVVRGDDNSEPRAPDVVWSPDSLHFAFLRCDNSQVADLWWIDHLATPRPTLRTLKYPFPGESVSRCELWICGVDDRSLLRLETERWPDQDLTSMSHEAMCWSEDGRTLLFERRSRDFRMVDLCAAEAATGRVCTLVEERMDDEVYTRSPVLLNESGTSLLWWSRRTGWGHWYRLESHGALRPLSTGDWNALDVVDVDRKRGLVYFMGAGREKGLNPYYQFLYRCRMAGGDVRLMTPEDGFHEIAFSPDHCCFVDNWSRPDQPYRSLLRNADGRLLLELRKADTVALDTAGYRPPWVFTALAADGKTELWGLIYLPFDFDPARRYPLVTRVYPGRQGEYIPWSFTPATGEGFLAQLGFAVVRFGNRGGTFERSREYREYGRDDFRGYGLDDKRTVIEQLGVRYPWIDLDRVGIFGGSSGGYMTISAMLEHPDFFKVGVAMTAPNDPAAYYNVWAERYAGVTQVADSNGAQRWEFGAAPGNIELADRLAGHLLMINGEVDEFVHPLHAMRMADAFVRAGKRFDMLFIPGAGHGLGDWRYLYSVILEYFADHLLGDRRETVDTLLKPD
jgi:dipeptidyl-peptidase-4